MNNPYSAPGAELSEPGLNDETYDPQVFALKGRIGRLRYIGYSWGLMFLCMMVCGTIFAVLMPTLMRGDGGKPGSGIVLATALLVYSPVIAVSLIMAIRRLNDLDNSGWLSLLTLVPLINFFFGLYLLFAPGTTGRNKYGPMPSKNPSWIWIVLIIPVFIAIIGILAAIAIPSYRQYVNKAKAAAQLQQTIQEQQSRQEQQSSQ
ncbi:MAG: DUF805 domain-containing protein [Burkholderiaceae bacterium]|nr:DUF805 domain-containing protein [Burkholderiaceae bacterium]